MTLDPEHQCLRRGDNPPPALVSTPLTMGHPTMATNNHQTMTTTQDTTNNMRTINRPTNKATTGEWLSQLGLWCNADHLRYSGGEAMYQNRSYNSTGYHGYPYTSQHSNHYHLQYPAAGKQQQYYLVKLQSNEDFPTNCWKDNGFFGKWMQITLNILHNAHFWSPEWPLSNWIKLLLTLIFLEEL